MEKINQEKLPDDSEQNTESSDKLDETEKISGEDQGLINKIRKLVNSKMEESKLPTKKELGYESTVGIYGGKLVTDKEGKMVYDTRGLWSKIDQFGDKVLRTYDEHHVKNPGEMLSKHPDFLLKHLFANSKRYRGTPEQTMENVRKFGLEEIYGEHPWGIEIKKPEIFNRGIALQDIFRQDLINSPYILEVNRFEALGKAAKYMHELHDLGGGIAEGNIYVFIFTEKYGSEVEKPILIIPSEIYNPEKKIPDIEKKATELLDLLASAGIEECRRSGDWENIKKVLQIVIKNYGEKKVIEMVASYVKRGRLTLPEDIKESNTDTELGHSLKRKVFAAHNTQRLGIVTPQITSKLREEIVKSCQG